MSTTPRISANDLALFMVSSDTARLGIIKRSYSPPTYITMRYTDARKVIKAHLSDISRNVNPLNQAEVMFQQRTTDNALTSLKQEDALKSIEVIQALRAMQNQLAGYNFTSAPQSQPKLILSGVTVSVRADLWSHGSSRGVDQIGGAILRMTQDDADTPNAISKRKEMGVYVATLLRMHLDQNNPTNNTPTNRLCMSIDVQHGKVFLAPNSNTRRMKDLQAACQVISALWGKV